MVTALISEASERICAFEAWILLAYACKCEKIDLLVNRNRAFSNGEIAAFKSCVEKRAAGCPIAYITGCKEFFSLPFKITTDCLIPRPETEMLVEYAIGLNPKKVLDLCAGSGAVAVAIAASLPDVQVTAVELNDAACAVLSDNCYRNNVSNRVEIKVMNVLTECIVGEYDIITCNPPYIKTADIDDLDVDVRDFEPRMALDGGEDGLLFYRILIPKMRQLLSKNGCALFEIGNYMAGQVLEIAKPYLDAEIKKDISGHDRMLVLTATKSTTLISKQ